MLLQSSQSNATISVDAQQVVSELRVRAYKTYFLLTFTVLRFVHTFLLAFYFAIALS